MRIIDITRELTSAPVYPGDPAPELTPIHQMELGDVCNLTSLSICLHNGTHIDAPRHFVIDGDTVDQLPLNHLCGECLVIPYEGHMLGEDAERIVAQSHPKRLLFKGNMSLSPSAAFVLSGAGLTLIGVENPSVALPADTEAVHRQLLLHNVALLEGLSLTETKVEPGRYLLMALPLKIRGAEGAPARVVLIDDRRNWRT